MIDDIDKGNITPDGSKQIFSDLWGIIDYRYDHEKATVITCQVPRVANVGMSFELLFGGSMADRLSHCIEIKIEGESGRGRYENSNLRPTRD